MASLRDATNQLSGLQLPLDPGSGKGSCDLLTLEPAKEHVTPLAARRLLPLVKIR